jgi:hypothetical protein
MKFQQEVKNRINFLQKEIDLAKRTDKDVKFVKELFPSVYIWVDQDVNISFTAKSMSEVKSMLRIFAKNGIMLDRVYEDQTNPIWYLKGINAIIRISPEWPSQDDTEGSAGATCKLVKVGETIHRYPKYKLVCSDKEDQMEDEIA